MVVKDGFKGILPSSPTFREEKFKDLITDAIMDQMMKMKKQQIKQQKIQERPVLSQHQERLKTYREHYMPMIEKVEDRLKQNVGSP